MAKAKRLVLDRLALTLGRVSAGPPQTFPSCPFLPALEPGATMDWRALNELGDDRGELFYLRCLAYGQHLWTRGLAARAILAVDRGLLADLQGNEAALAHHPLPYHALSWLIAHTPEGVFIGNPRVHYQHLADRVRDPRRAQRSARAWACWHLARLVRPDLPGDPRHMVDEPEESSIAHALETHGIRGEPATWRHACQTAVTSRPGIGDRA